MNKVAPSPLYDILKQLKSEIFSDLRVCLPGTITAVNAENGTVSVAPGVMQNVAQLGLTSGLDFTYPQLTGLPVFTVQGGGVGAVMPVKIGDGCLVVFSDRALDSWFTTGQAAPLPSLRMHNITDGIALVGLNPQTSPLNTPLDPGEGGLCETQNAFGAKVAINPTTHKITLANGTEDLFTSITALTTTLTNLITSLAVLNTAIATTSPTNVSSAITAAAANEATIVAVQTALTAVQVQFAGLLY
jgi:hypothetical protein